MRQFIAALFCLLAATAGADSKERQIGPLGVTIEHAHKRLAHQHHITVGERGR